MVVQYRIVYPDELNHHGVKGMKGGVRKQIQARRRYKRASDKSYSKSIENKYYKKMQNLHQQHEKEVGGNWDSPKARRLDSKHYKEREALISEGRKAVTEARLKDAGYSTKEAKVGADWMIAKGYNISSSDNNWYTKR